MLTATQSRVLAFIGARIRDHGYPPTRIEISRHFGYRSPNAAECHLRALAAKGVIELIPSISRGIRMVQGA